MLSIIVRNVSKWVYPFILLFGAYIIVHGHLTPGGGFPGGVLLATSLIILTLAFGITRRKERKEVEFAEDLETDALIAVLGVFLFTILLAKVFPRFELLSGAPGTLFSGGPIMLLNIGGGLEVAAAFSIIFISMVMMKQKRVVKK